MADKLPIPSRKGSLFKPAPNETPKQERLRAGSLIVKPLPASGPIGDGVALTSMAHPGDPFKYDPVLKGKHLIEWRGDKTQRTIAKQLGISLNTLKKYEASESVPKLITLACLAIDAGLSE